MFLGAFLVLSEITMKTWLTMIATLAVTATSVMAAEPLPPEGCSRVKLVFVMPPEEPRNDKQAMVNVGGMVLPIDSVRPVSIFVDGKFTGHSMASPYSSVQPSLHLRAGDHEFEFKCDGFTSTKVKLTVLPNQCTQNLIVKMTKQADEKTAKSKKSIGTARRLAASERLKAGNAE
jgi:hypothetical protein